jgi:hypothetical protein
MLAFTEYLTTRRSLSVVWRIRRVVWCGGHELDSPRPTARRPHRQNGTAGADGMGVAKTRCGAAGCSRGSSRSRSNVAPHVQRHVGRSRCSRVICDGSPSTPLDRRDVRSWALGDWPNGSVPTSQDRSTGMEVFGDRESHGHRDPLDLWARRSGGDRRGSTPTGTWCLVRPDAAPRPPRVGRHVAQTCSD